MLDVPRSSLYYASRARPDEDLEPLKILRTLGTLRGGMNTEKNERNEVEAYWSWVFFGGLRT